MARGEKTEKVLTPEEKLAQALVPVEEQPYPVPENWLWLHGNNLFLPMETKKPRGDTFTYIDIDSIDNKLQTVSKPKVLPVSKAPSRASRALHIGDTLFSMVRPYLKNIAYIDESLSDAIASTGFYVCQPKKNISPRFLYYLMTSPYVVDGLNKFMKGDNSPSIRKDDLQQFVYPVPPFAEQQRIVDRIESLFTKLDEAKEKIRAVVDSFETRKATILHKAFTGELTAQWRKQHHTKKIVWEKKKLSQCCKIGSGGTPSRKCSEYYNGVTPWIKTGEIDWNEVYDSEEHITEQAIADSSAKLYEPGAVLVAMYGMGMTRGRAAILMTQAATNQAVCVLQPNDQLNNRFLYYFFMYKYWHVREKAIGGNQLNLSATIISKFDIPFPDIGEQVEITHILDNFFTQEKHAKEITEAVLEQIESIKKSILARAFRGELGTNNPAEESAMELLKTII